MQAQSTQLETWTSMWNWLTRGSNAVVDAQQLPGEYCVWGAGSSPAEAQSRGSNLGLDIGNIRRCLRESLAWPRRMTRAWGQVECEACGSRVNCNMPDPEIEISKYYLPSCPLANSSYLYLGDLLWALLMPTLAALKRQVEPGCDSQLRYDQHPCRPTRPASPTAGRTPKTDARSSACA